MDDVQFALGIVLSNLGEDAAAKQVITFLGTNLAGAGEQRVNSVLRERRMLEKRLGAESGMNIVDAFINYLFENKELKKQAGSQIHSTVVGCSLKDLLQHTDRGRLYEETMNFLFGVTSNMILYRYLFTPLFMKSFKATVLQMVRRTKGAARVFQRGGLSDSDYTAILNDFSKCIKANSCNGSYSYCSGDPDAFLCSAPLRKWYPATPGNEFLKILHGQGQDVELGSNSDGTTMLDLRGITDTGTHVSIDFSMVCAEIAEASKLLFTHNNSRMAFYDIFSYHREQNILEKKKLFKSDSFAIRGINFVIEKDTLDSECGDNESIRNKYCGRRALCEVMEAAFSRGVTREDLYPLYLQLLKVTSSLHTKNAQRLFRVDGRGTKQIYTNGQIFQILVNGYAALYSLLDYLRSSDNTTGVTENSFPVRIFRDSMCLKRFKSLEDYVNTGSEILELVDEVNSDGDRRKKIVDGFFNNDYVYDLLCQNGISFDEMLGPLISKPLNYIAAVVDEVNLTNEDTLLMYELKNVAEDLQNYGYPDLFLDGGYRGLSYAQALVKLDSLADMVIAVKKRNILNFYTYHYVTQYLVLLKYVMEKEGIPVVNSSGEFILKGGNTPAVFLPVEKMAAGYKAKAEAALDGDEKARLMNVYNQLHTSYLKRIMCCYYIYEFYTGSAPKNGAGSLQVTRTEFHDMLYVNDVLFVYLREVNKMIRSMPDFSDVNEIYLALVVLSGYCDLIGMPDMVTDISSLGFLFEHGCSVYLYAELISSLDSLKVICSRSNVVLLASVNRFFKIIQPVKCIFNSVYREINSKIKITGGNIVCDDYSVLNLLRQENIAVMGITHPTDAAALTRSKLRVMINRFDANNYACIGSRLLAVPEEGFSNAFTYFHKNGYATVVDKLNMTAHTRDLRNKDLVLIRNALLFSD